MEIFYEEKKTDGRIWGNLWVIGVFRDDMKCRGCLVRLRNEAQEGMMCGKTPQTWNLTLHSHNLFCIIG